jgi:FkbM family methyltransferase
MSNTYMLYRLGARGVLVEPDPDRAQLLKEARPRDVVINAGVAFDDRREATLFQLSNPVFNTFSQEKAERVVRDSATWPPGQRQRIIGARSLRLIPINEIISSHFADAPPHLVSIDTKGSELAILRTLNTDLLSRDPDIPCILCVEDCDGLEMNALLEAAGFDVAARTPSNWIFVRQRERWVFMRHRDKVRLPGE